MRRLTDLKTTHKSPRQQPSLLDLRDKDTPVTPRSPHIIDLNKPTRNRPSPHERIRRDSFFEAIPMYFNDTAPMGLANKSSASSNWRRQWRSTYRRSVYEMGIFLQAARKQITSLIRAVSPRQAVIAALIVGAIASAAFGISMLSRSDSRSNVTGATSTPSTTDSPGTDTQAEPAAISTLPEPVMAINQAIGGGSFMSATLLPTTTFTNNRPASNPGSGSTTPAPAQAEPVLPAPTPSVEEPLPTDPDVPVTPPTDPPADDPAPDPTPTPPTDPGDGTR